MGQPPPSTFGHFRGPLWRFCEAVFTLDPPESRIPGRGWADATNSPQIGELQVTGVRRPGRPCRRPPAGAAGQALDENVGAARGGKRARDVGVSVGVRPRGPSVQLRGSIPLPPPPIGSWESLVDVVAGSSPVGGTRSYCIPNRAGESQFPSVSPPEPTIGLSPRVRGNRSGSAPLSVMTRSIPACAGEPKVFEPGGETEAVYPRVCGGTKQRNVTSSMERHVINRSRSIPACAGEPRPVDTTPQDESVYPRVCGGTSTTERIRTETVGLSPRVRGNQQVTIFAPQLPGSIPACAGEPPKRCAMSTICRVYPRVCGGTKASLAAVPAGLGLSPRVRGNHFAYRLHLV